MVFTRCGVCGPPCLQVLAHYLQREFGLSDEEAERAFALAGRAEVIASSAPSRAARRGLGRIVVWCNHSFDLHRIH
jgi:hypothetical protein